MKRPVKDGAARRAPRRIGPAVLQRAGEPLTLGDGTAISGACSGAVISGSQVSPLSWKAVVDGHGAFAADGGGERGVVGVPAPAFGRHHADLPTALDLRRPALRGRATRDTAVDDRTGLPTRWLSAGRRCVDLRRLLGVGRTRFLGSTGGRGVGLG